MARLVMTVFGAEVPDGRLAAPTEFGPCCWV